MVWYRKVCLVCVKLHGSLNEFTELSRLYHKDGLRLPQFLFMSVVSVPPAHSAKDLDLTVTL